MADLAPGAGAWERFGPLQSCLFLDCDCDFKGSSELCFTLFQRCHLNELFVYMEGCVLVVECSFCHIFYNLSCLYLNYLLY